MLTDNTDQAQIAIDLNLPVFQVSEEMFIALTQMIDEQSQDPDDSQKLTKLLSTPAPWEQGEQTQQENEHENGDLLFALNGFPGSCFLDPLNRF
ncbi:MAG: hypothetical protein ACRCXZ_03055 [Patescibacteria group bacterium]